MPVKDGTGKVNVAKFHYIVSYFMNVYDASVNKMGSH